GIKLESVEVRGADDFVAALRRLSQRRPSAVVMIEDTLTYAYRSILAEFTMKNRVPAITAGHAFPENGGLMSYGVRMSGLFRRAAGQGEKILKGAQPTGVPIQQATQFGTDIKPKTAQAPGLPNPPSMLGRADQLIE